MRNFQSRFADSHVPQQQNVQIKRPRTVGNPRRPIPSKLLLNRQQSLQQRARFQLRLQRHHCVHKARLLSKPHRLSRVERRSLRNPPQPLQANHSRSQRSLRRPRPTSQVSAHPNVSRPHVIKTIATGVSFAWAPEACASPILVASPLETFPHGRSNQRGPWRPPQ